MGLSMAEAKMLGLAHLHPDARRKAAPADDAADDPLAGANKTERAFAAALDLRDALYVGPEGGREWFGAKRQMIDLVIAGGQSGPGAKACRLDWIRSLISQCREAGAGAFVKQLGSYVLDDQAPPGRLKVELRDSHGGAWEEWPEDLRVREFPTPRLAAAS